MGSDKAPPAAHAAVQPPTDPLELRLCYLPHLERYTSAPQPYSALLTIPGAEDHGPVPESYGQEAGPVPPPLGVPDSWIDDPAVTVQPLTVPDSWRDPEPPADEDVAGTSPAEIKE